ncbi:RNA polymerase sigma factor [Cohnella silvisoli]|uniref:Sigma-70 family RNA polymerase sigma factor n=1 Tax=Cohnella silvisoli TaxID=2873699 RepID=A0ABV1KNT9_9BACL|nr:sigma-70 family RNA polymerase sigma factor [Cohnella silvisoli]MCD9020967.1 sigma-70 family RNA polymerase sigma factor [Cohnella silvisoli]
MPNHSDGELMRQLREGRRDALAELYDRHVRLVYSFAVRVAGSESLAREIVQLVFTRLWATKAEYDSSKGAYTSWLITMTRHISIDVLRRERRHQAMVPIDDINESYGSLNSDNPESVFIRSDQQSVIATASRRLSQPQRRVIELLYWKGYTLNEIAEMGGEPVGTVKSRLHQALKTLRRHLQGLREES